jgi:hypothetical protein
MENAIPSSELPNSNQQAQNVKLQTDVRTYFLNQGKHIKELHEIIDRGIFRTLLSSLIYWFVEIALYLLFISALAIVFILPTELSHEVMVSDKTSLNMSLSNEDFKALMYTIKFIFFLLALMPLILARVIRRSRNKSITIMEASAIADDMKKDFDKAIGNLSL